MSTPASALSLDGTELEPAVFAQGIPHELFAQLRREAPVAWYPGPHHGYWCITRHADVVAVSKDTATFSSHVGGVGIGDPAHHGPDMAQSILTTDPPEHRRLRRAVLPPLQARAVSTHEPFLRATAAWIVADAVKRGDFDFSTDVARQLPIRALNRVLGAASDEVSLDRMVGWTIAALYVDDPHGGGVEALEAAVEEIARYGRELTAAKRREPGDDLVSGLVRGDHEGGPLTDAEIAQMFEIFAIAGSDSTRQTLTHGMLGLIEAPDQWERLREDRSLVPGAAEEMLRWASVALSFGRTTTRDIELGGQLIREGDRVVLWYCSANYDEAVFDEPLRFDVTRRPNPHCAFGGRGGPHMCIGANLARLQLRVMLEELLEHVPRLELTAPPRRLASNMDHGIASMPVRVVR
jgi:cholest-4-en-3-one 26-monooxygenase